MSEICVYMNLCVNKTKIKTKKKIKKKLVWYFRLKITLFAVCLLAVFFWILPVTKMDLKI